MSLIDVLHSELLDSPSQLHEGSQIGAGVAFQVGCRLFHMMELINGLPTRLSSCLLKHRDRIIGQGNITRSR